MPAAGLCGVGGLLEFCGFAARLGLPAVWRRVSLWTGLVFGARSPIRSVAWAGWAADLVVEVVAQQADTWNFAVLQWCGGWRLGVGEGGRGLVPVSACDFGFGPWARVVVWPVCRRLVFVVLGDPWYFAVCGLGVVAGCVAVGACMDWTGFRLVFSDSVLVSGAFGGRDGCCWLSWRKRILGIPRVCGSSVIGGPLLSVPVVDWFRFHPVFSDSVLGVRSPAQSRPSPRSSLAIPPRTISLD